MPSVFTRIIAGELPSRTVYADADVVAFLSIAPLRPGHTLIVPRVEVDDWLDLEPAVWARVNDAARLVGAALRTAFKPARVATMIVGLEVPHAHLHLVPIRTELDIDLGRADTQARPADLDEAAVRIRAALGDAAATSPALPGAATDSVARLPRR